uniref:Peptidase S1 domain-containing protein n=1 Tax=Timema bartmani TaxID=61472 RepID=A0A7R9HZH6_9NEOP|nr:unnamed protein product [Timema bartmani]
MIWLALFSILALLLQRSQCFQHHNAFRERPATNEVVAKILGGEKADLGDYPFLVAVEHITLKQFCAATVMNNVWAISAAHCFGDYSNPKVLQARSGSLELNSGGIVHPFEKVISHPGFGNGKKLSDDIALIKRGRSGVAGRCTCRDSAISAIISAFLYWEGVACSMSCVRSFTCLTLVFVLEAPPCTEKVEKPFTDNPYVKYVKLPKVEKGSYLKTGTKVVSAGWGITSMSRFYGESSPILLDVTLDILDNDKCSQEPFFEKFEEYGLGITEGMICTETLGKDTTAGDSGGPLLLKEGNDSTLIGVVSFGEGSGTYNFDEMSEKRTFLTLMEKYEIIQEVDEKKITKTEITRWHGIPKSTFFTILKIREDIVNVVQKEGHNVKAKNFKGAMHVNLKQAMLEWFSQH